MSHPPRLADYQAHYRKDAELIEDPWALPPVRAASEDRRLEAMVRLLQLQPGQRLLDMGCGSGWLAARCRARGAWVVATDIAPRGVAAVRRRFPPVSRLVAADVYHMPLRDGQFDAAVLSEVLEHLEAVEAAVAEAARLLRPGGRLLVTVPYRETIVQHLCIHCNRLTPANAHLHSFDEEALSGLLARCGLRPRQWLRLGNKLLELAGLPQRARWLPYPAWRLADALLNRLTGRPAFVAVLAARDR
ncbi:MAG: class I SAM-dependent methyltransferase [Gemmatimonadota bacterium]